MIRPRIALYQPDIAGNTGTILRLAACLGLEVHIIEPAGFDLSDRNLKRAGILIENVLSADNIERSIAGVGINVNQIKFLSDAPNPVSMAQITNMSYDLDTLLEDVCSTILSSFNAEDASVGVASEKEYAERLWRNDGYYPYESEGEQFEAKIVNVAHNGMLTLERRDGVRCEYAFKEVAFVL